ncbi:MAG TPA: serine/threonine-protein kinase [Anaeromyxobacteraceae bacterium]
MPPRAVGPYEVLSVIGRGGIGTVYRARHRGSGAEVAVKLLGPPPACDPTTARRLAREFEALRGLDHPNVVRVFDVGVHEGYSFLAMELVEGLDLRSYLSPSLDASPYAGGNAAPGGARLELDAWSDEPETESLLTPPLDVAPPTLGPDAIRAFAALMDEPETEGSASDAAGREEPAERIRVAEVKPLAPQLLDGLNGPARRARLVDAVGQVCEGLAHVHAHGLVHRDLKPSNIMVDDARRVRLMDFGLVKLASDAAHITQHGRVVGTYRYMSPEQARGEPVDLRADLYSLGVILFELLCGRAPFLSRRPAELWNEIISRPPVAPASLNPGVDPGLARLALRLLAKDPRQRLQSAAEVAAALRQSSRPG